MNFKGLLSLLSLLLFSQLIEAHIALLQPRGKECFYENLKAQDELVVTFQVGDRDAEATEQLTADFWVSKAAFARLAIMKRNTNQ